MAPPISTEGIAPFAVPNTGKECSTWYKIFGTLSTETVPLVALHGGPGAGHEYLLSLEDLNTQHGIPVVLYDQIGCGKSTALEEKNGDRSFWTVDLFERELENVLKHLGIIQFDLFGHSWGGMLASVYAAKRPQGLRKLILMSAPASVDLALKGSAELRTQLPQEVQDIMTHHEGKADFEAPEYTKACFVFYKKFLCRCDPWPQEVETSLYHMAYEPTVYGSMWGPSELFCTGTLKGWSAVNEAHRIQSPTLLINGQYDEITESAVAPFSEQIPTVEWVVLPDSSHMGMWEERERSMRVISEFLTGK